MPLEVGTMVDAVVSDYYTDETGSVACNLRVEEIVEGRSDDFVRVSTEWQETEEEKRASRIHGRVVREHTNAVWAEMESVVAGLPAEARKKLFKAVIRYSDMECRNVLREAEAARNRRRG